MLIVAIDGAQVAGERIDRGMAVIGAVSAVGFGVFLFGRVGVKRRANIVFSMAVIGRFVSFFVFGQAIVFAPFHQIFGFCVWQFTSFEEIKGAEGPEDEEHRHQQAEVTDAVDDKGFAGGVAVFPAFGRFFVPPEADQQKGAEADAFPADEHHQEVVGGDQDEHEGQEHIKIGEEARRPFVAVHIAAGIQMNKRANAGHDQHHGDAQGVDAQLPGYLQPDGFDSQPAGQQWRIDHGRAAVGAGHIGQQKQRDQESEEGGEAADISRPFFAYFHPDEEIDDGPQRRDEYDQGY